MATPALTLCEDGILAALLPLKEANKVRVIEAIEGEWGDDVLKRVLGSAPGVYVHHSGGRNIQQTSQPRASARWFVYVATAHAQSAGARNRGDGRQEGAYALLEWVIEALHGLTIEGHGTLRFLSYENLWDGSIGGRGQALWVAVFDHPVAFDVSLDLDDLPDLTGVDVTWDLAPADDTAEATDIIDLETE